VIVGVDIMEMEIWNNGHYGFHAAEGEMVGATSLSYGFQKGSRRIREANIKKSDKEMARTRGRQIDGT